MTGPSLREAQTWLVTAITHGESVEEGVAFANQELGPGEALARHITGGPRLGAMERLHVYHHGYRARLVECLADDYAGLQHAIGHDAFESLCREYVRTHPSTSFSLNFYGRHMADFCRARSDSWRDLAVDLASLEWSIVEAIHAAEPGGIFAEELAALKPEDWENLRLFPSDALHVLRTSYPVNEWYRAFRMDEEPALPERETTAVAIYRKGMTIWRVTLSEPQVALLESLIAGTPLGAALGGASATEEEVTRWFQDWMAGGFFGHVEVLEPAAG